MDNQERIKVLVVDDEKLVCDFLKRLLEFEGFKVKVAGGGYQALELAKEEEFDLVFLDIRMPRMNGLETYSRLKANQPGLGIVFMTGYAFEEALLDKTKQPGIMLLRKPFDDIGRIKDLAYKALEERRNALKMQSDFIDRRSYVRLNISLAVDYREQKAEACFNSSLSKDVSPGGMRIVCGKEILPSTPLEIIIKEEDRATTLEARGEVVWSREIKDSRYNYEIGIKFTQVDYSELAAILIRRGNIACPEF